MRKILIFLVIFIFVCLSAFAAKKPDWVTKRPIDSNAYIGIGVAQKDTETSEYIQKAKDRALREIASEITVTISGATINQILEKAGVVKEEFESQIQSSTQAQLEGYELVDTWEDKTQYWVYYKLSKIKYTQLRKEKIDKALSLSLDFFTKAEQRKVSNQITEALQLYLQSLNPIEPYLTEPLETMYNGQKIYMLNTIHSSLQQVLSTISLKPVQPEVDATIGKGLDNPILYKALYMTAPISNLPIQFGFIKGEGDLIEYAKTSLDGIALCMVSSIYSADKMQVIKGELALDNLISAEESNPIILDIIKSLTIPSANVLLNVSGPKIFIESTELNFGESLDVNYIEPKLKEKLSEYGYNFVDMKSDADYMIIIDAQSRKGSTVYSMCSAFVDASISVMDMSTYDEIYKNTFSNVKGINNDMDKAGLAAFDNAAAQISAEIIQIMQ
ncbi:MAG: LPP20 family lipoprotein [Candidatus Cloacimonetes bacterium]|nr:LPP20 family lipoprotein [Candidatus Cloacimonadota bacterium]